MNRRQLSGLFLLAATGAATRASWAHEGHDGTAEAAPSPTPPLSVTVSFGAGLNTAQAGNRANHHILPGTIDLSRGGVVNFVVAGFHQVTVYNPSKKLEDVTPNDPSGIFVNDPAGRFYLGIAPAVPPSGKANPSNAINRVESVSFPATGTYLVICNVLDHFRDGMYAFVRVR
jgi:plastocyanin